MKCPECDQQMDYATPSAGGGYVCHFCWGCRQMVVPDEFSVQKGGEIIV